MSYADTNILEALMSVDISCGVKVGYLSGRRQMAYSTACCFIAPAIGLAKVYAD